MFRRKYLDYRELNEQLLAWAEAHPAFVRLTSIGRTAEGRDIPLLVIGHDPDERRPAVWVDGNMHATELAGSSVALAIAEEVIRLHEAKLDPRLRGDDKAVRGDDKAVAPAQAGAQLPPHMADVLRESLFYILPRVSPDGAEAVLESGRYVRSSPVDERLHKGHAYWESHDFDGDGTIGFMRRRDSAGELVELEGFPGVMVPRLPEDTGPYYKLYPEGRIVNFDGRRIPDPHFLSDNQYDFNRNFPYSWAPDHEQEGAGHYPGSAPETRAMMDFATAHPNIFAWLNLHTFGGVFIRPLGDRPDHKMDQEDLAVYRQVEHWATQFTGYPTVSGFHEFLYQPETPLKGDLTDYAYHQRGAIAYVVELWDIFTQIGMERRKPFVEVYNRLDRKDFVALAKWDRDVNQGRVFRAWRKVTHPQLGEVEVGGFDMRVGISNPPYEKLDEVCINQSRAFLRVASLVPRVRVEAVKTERIGAGHTRVELRIANEGYLSTYGLSSARKLQLSEPLRVDVQCDGVTLEAPAESVIEIGHLAGWGQGLYNGATAFFPWTRGNANERFVTLMARGKGRLRLKAGSVRVGYRTLEVDVG